MVASNEEKKNIISAHSGVAYMVSKAALSAAGVSISAAAAIVMAAASALVAKINIGGMAGQRRSIVASSWRKSAANQSGAGESVS